jgi:hypothetical protein
MKRRQLEDSIPSIPIGSQHIRLISRSEKNTHESLDPVCINTTMQANNTAARYTYRSSAAVCQSIEEDRTLCTVSSEHAAALDKGGRTG